MTFSKQSVSYWIENLNNFSNLIIVYNEVKIVVDYFESYLLANNCNLNFLKEEFKILHNHVKRYVSKCLSEKCWPMLADWKFITCYWDLSYCSIVKCWARKYSHFCGIFFQKRGSPSAMKCWRCYSIFDHMLTKARNDMETLWIFFDRVSWWYRSQKKMLLTGTCLPKNLKIY